MLTNDDDIQSSAFVSCNDTRVSSFHDHYFQSPTADANDVEDGPLGDDIQFITINKGLTSLNKKKVIKKGNREDDFLKNLCKPHIIKNH